MRREPKYQTSLDSPKSVILRSGYLLIDGKATHYYMQLTLNVGYIYYAHHLLKVALLTKEESLYFVSPNLFVYDY